MPLGLLLTQPSQIPPCFETKLHRNYTDFKKDSISPQQWPWLTPSGPPVRHVSSITPSHRFHTALLFDKQNCSSLLMYIGCFFLFLFYKRNVWNFVEIQRCPSLPFQHWPRYCIFFLLEKSSWLLYIVMTLMMTMITYLLAVRGALLPACACMKGAMTVWPNGGWDEVNNDIKSVCRFHNVECFLSTRDSWIVCVCACECVSSCVRLLWDDYLLQSQEQMDVNLTACFWQKWCVHLRAWLFGNCDI